MKIAAAGIGNVCVLGMGKGGWNKLCRIKKT